MASDTAKLAVCKRLAQFRSRDDLADVIISCRSYDDYIHYFVLTLHSEVLKRLCDEDSPPPGMKRQILLHSFEEESVERLVSYLYSFDYEEFRYDHEDRQFQICLHPPICIMAAALEMEELQELAIRKFKSYLETPVSLPAFTKLLEIIYDPKASPFATQELRQCMVDALTDEDCVFLEDISDFDIRKLVESYDELSEDIAELQYQARDPESEPAKFRLTKTFLDSFPRSIHPNFPTVLRYDDKWQEISCGICGANAGGKTRSKFFDGILGLQSHIKIAHGLVAPLEERAKWCRLSVPDAKEMKRMQRGIGKMRPFKGVAKAEWKKVDLQRLKAKRSSSG